MKDNFFSKYYKKTLKLALKHKFISIIILLAVMLTGYRVYVSMATGSTGIQYVSAAAEKGTIVLSVSGSGQVSASNQVDVKPKASGNVTYVGVKAGQSVSSGAVLAQLDSTDAQKTVRDAEINLENAQITLDKLRGLNPSVPKNKLQAQDDLSEAYDSGYNEVSDAFLDLPSVMTGLTGILYGNTKSSQNIAVNKSYYVYYSSRFDSDVSLAYSDRIDNSYQIARTAYDKCFNDFKEITRSSNTEKIEALITETYETSKSISDVLKDASSLILFYKDKATSANLPITDVADSQLTSLNGYIGKINSALSSLSNIEATIKNDKDLIDSADLDLQSQELSLEQRQNSLNDARAALSNYTIRAPFGGVIAAVNIQRGDAASSGTSAFTVITTKGIAEIPFNEVDVSKVSVGQKATLTFDAIDGLSITGEVSEVGLIGTVSQGVVSYNVKIVFDTQDVRIKPGMSVSAAVITDVKQNVLTVSNSAVKQDTNGRSYVEVLVDGTPQQKIVVTGLSNDTLSEISSGLQEGDIVVTQTITSASSATKSSSGFSLPGITGGGGNAAVRTTIGR